MAGYVQGAPQGTSFSLSNTGVFRSELWLNDLIRYRRTNLVMAQAVKKSSFTGKKGEKIHIPRTGRLGVRPKAPGAPVFFQSRQENEWTMIIDRYMESSFSVDNLVTIQADQNIQAIYTEEAGRALAEDIDNFLLALRAAVVAAATSDHITSTNPITYADILSAWEILNVRKVPKENRALFIGPNQEATLFSINEFIQNGTFNSGDVANIKNGQIGMILGMPVMVTTTIGPNSLTGYTNGDGAAGQPTPGMNGSPYFPTQPVDKRDGTSVTVAAMNGLTAGHTSALMVHSDWCHLAMQKAPSVDVDWSVEYQENRVVQTQIYGAKLYHEDAAVVISTDENALVA